MKTVGVHEAKTHLSRLIERAVKGEPFVIAKGGTPMVKVMAIDTVLSQSWVFLAKSKNWDHKFNDLQDSKFIKNKLCDRTFWNAFYRSTFLDRTGIIFYCFILESDYYVQSNHFEQCS